MLWKRRPRNAASRRRRTDPPDHTGSRSHLTRALADNAAALRQVLGENDDLRYQPIKLRWEGRDGLLVYQIGLCDTKSLGSSVLEPLARSLPPADPPDSLESLAGQLVAVVDRQEVTDLDRVRDDVLRGKAALLVDGFAGVLLVGLQEWQQRSVEEPLNETVLRGPREGFVENATTNLALVRRRLCDANLQVREYRVGTRSKTRVVVLHLADIARPELVHEITTRVQAVEYDAITDAHQLREFLVGGGLTLFPRVESTERPDHVALALLAGKVAILVDTSPFALLAPATLVDFLWPGEDYYTMPGVTLMIRLVRVIGWLAVMFLSPIYIAIEMYNPDFVRSDLALFLARERAGIPLNAAMEIFFLETMMEMILESTIRLPTKIGSAATIVGGLIIGQAAVQAKLISALVVIVAAISAISSLTFPGQELGQVWRVTKWVMVGAASVFGLYGLFGAFFCLVSWLAAQDSFGTPYLAPLAPFIPQDLAQNALYRRPWGLVRSRSRTLRPLDPTPTSAPQDKKYRDRGER